MQVIVTQPPHKLTYIVQLEHEGRKTDLNVYGPIRSGKMSDVNCFDMAVTYARKVSDVLDCKLTIQEEEV